jgi:tetratricopeptide (TPR) repeat protein
MSIAYGIFLLETGRGDEALKEFEHLSGAYPEDRAQRTRWVAACQRLGRTADAEKILNGALRKNPRDLEALLQRGELLITQGKLSQAQEDFNQVLKLKADSAELHYAVAGMHAKAGETALEKLETGDKVHAREALSAAKATKSDFTAADVSLARIDLMQADWKDARKELNALISQKGDEALAHLWLEMLESSVGNDATALTEFQKVVDLQPNNATALNNLAYLMVERGDRSEQPLQYAQRARELAPDSPRFADTLGWVFYRKGAYRLAIPHLEMAAIKLPTAVIQYHLGMALYKAGEEQRGRSVLKAALRLDPKLPQAAEVERILNGSRK